VNPEAPTKVDDETDHWPVPDEFEQVLCALKRSFAVQPLRVYVNDRFVEPKDVSGILANGLVELHFTLKHFHISRSGEKDFDSFTAVIEQIIVLKTGAPKAPNAYKRKGPREGPVVVKRPRLDVKQICKFNIH
jgi:hypothetical protein